MALSGDLKDFGLLQLLALVQVTSKTGMLILQRSGETASVFFDNGQLTRVKPPESRAESLPLALYRSGRIDREQFDWISAQASPSEKAAALMLEDQGSISREEIVDFVRERSLAELYTLLTWPDGSFRFEVGPFASEEDIVAATELAPILEKGSSYLEEWRHLVSYIPDLEKRLRLLPEPSQQLQEVCLGLPEWRMVASLAADIPLRQVAQSLGLDEFTVRQTAYRLIDAGLAEVVQGEIEPDGLSLEKREPPESEQPKGGAFSWLFGQRQK